MTPQPDRNITRAGLVGFLALYVLLRLLFVYTAPWTEEEHECLIAVTATNDEPAYYTKPNVIFGGEGVVAYNRVLVRKVFKHFGADIFNVKLIAVATSTFTYLLALLALGRMVDARRFLLGAAILLLPSWNYWWADLRLINYQNVGWCFLLLYLAWDDQIEGRTRLPLLGLAAGLALVVIPFPMNVTSIGFLAIASVKAGVSPASKKRVALHAACAAFFVLTFKALFFGGIGPLLRTPLFGNLWRVDQLVTRLNLKSHNSEVIDFIDDTDPFRLTMVAIALALLLFQGFVFFRRNLRTRHARISIPIFWHGIVFGIPLAVLGLVHDKWIGYLLCVFPFAFLAIAPELGKRTMTVAALPLCAVGGWGAINDLVFADPPEHLASGKEACLRLRPETACEYGLATRTTLCGNLMGVARRECVKEHLLQAYFRVRDAGLESCDEIPANWRKRPDDSPLAYRVIGTEPVPDPESCLMTMDYRLAQADTTSEALSACKRLENDRSRRWCLRKAGSFHASAGRGPNKRQGDDFLRGYCNERGIQNARENKDRDSPPPAGCTEGGALEAFRAGRFVEFVARQNPRTVEAAINACREADDPAIIERCLESLPHLIDVRVESFERLNDEFDRCLEFRNARARMGCVKGLAALSWVIGDERPSHWCRRLDRDDERRRCHKATRTLSDGFLDRASFCLETPR
ncbi:hypothetical protein K8I61_07765 [bacterium]|nr:hypothetical protein [bacterium]